MSRCLGEVGAALVDGELDHAARERALAHLAHCAPCRSEVDAQRRLKSRLAELEAPAPSDALTARLRALEVGRAPAVAGPHLAGPSVRSGTARPVSPRPVAGPLGRPAPAGRPRGARSLRRRAAAGSAVAALGVATALVLGAPPQRPPSTAVDPGTDAFVAEFVSTLNDDAGSVVTPVSATGASSTGGPRSAR